MSNLSTISPYSYPGIRFDDIPQNAFKNQREKSFKESEKRIINLIANQCGVTAEEIISESRKREVVDARHIYCAAVRLKYRITLNTIGETLGKRDHTTIRHALIKFMERYATEDNYKTISEDIFGQLGVSYHNQKLVTISSYK